MPDSGTIVVLACAVLEDEVAALARALDPAPHVELLEQGLHNEPDTLTLAVQEAVDRIEAECPDCTGIALAYGLCSRGLEGVRSSRVPLALPRAHDCITLLLGSKEAYAAYMRDNPPTYWYSPGWNRHGNPPCPERMAARRAEYAEAYGEENADFLMESMEHWVHDYRRAGYVHLGVTDTTDDEVFTRKAAEHFGWEYESIRGDDGLMRALIAGEWDDERFLVLRPGQVARMVDTMEIVEAREATDGR